MVLVFELESSRGYNTMFQISVFYILRVNTLVVELLGHAVFVSNFLRDLHTIFSGGYTSLCSHRRARGFLPSSPTSSPTLVCVDFSH